MMASPNKPEQEFDKFKELARKIIAVPKQEIKELEQAEKGKRHSTKKRRATRSSHKRHTRTRSTSKH
jgi:hypothetical protein